MNFRMQQQPNSIEKSRRWQIYIRKGGKRTHTAYVSHDGQSDRITIRKLLREIPYNPAPPALSKLRYDVLHENQETSRDFRVRVETHRLCSEDDPEDKGVRDWLQLIMVNPSGALCAPVASGDIQFECIRRKYKAPEKTNFEQTKHCGTWRNGRLKFQIQWVEQTVCQGYGGTEPNYEICMTCTELCRLLKSTRLPASRAPPIDIYTVAPLVYGLLSSATGLLGADTKNYEDHCMEIVDSLVVTAEPSEFKLACERNGVKSREVKARHAIERECELELDADRDRVHQLLKEAEELELQTQPGYTDWETIHMEKKVKHHGVFKSTELIPSNSNEWCVARTKRRYSEWVVYVEVEVGKGTRNTSGCKIGWLGGKGWHEICAYEGTEEDPIAQGDILGSCADFTTRTVTFWHNERVVRSESFPIETLHVHPMLGLYNFTVKITHQTLPPDNKLGRENTMPVSEVDDNPYETCYEDANATLNDSIYSRYTQYEVADDSKAGQLAASELPKQYFVEFSKLAGWVKVGEGGFGKVYKCEKQDEHDEVAVKELTNSSPDSKVKFVKEIEILLGLRYNKILSCYGWSEGPLPTKTLYMVTEFCHGGTLKAKLEALPPGTEERTTISIQAGISMAQALSHLHSSKPHPLIHLDVAARNVLLTQDPPTNQDCYRLADVGLLAQESDHIHTICIPWAPPEIVALPPSERTATKAHDSWSLGCLVYEVLHGEPYLDLVENKDGWRSAAMTELKQKRKPAPPKYLSAPLTQDLWKIVDEKLWDLDPTTRPPPQSIVTLLQKLQKPRGVERQQSSAEYTPASPGNATVSSLGGSFQGLGSSVGSVLAQPVKTVMKPMPKKTIKTLRGSRRGRN
eukprot:TRINITY_DN3013_c1_g1_i1.p1 TRINITY_DN3013_c1_g1~~TRINITY_DN3013_c1_g1_i1.p1  ORF type:complete len:959 (+),score=150.91 TRINITY_DN3013_c1_g1_i1:303-2879(+)